MLRLTVERSSLVKARRSGVRTYSDMRGGARYAHPCTMTDMTDIVRFVSAAVMGDTSLGKERLVSKSNAAICMPAFCQARYHREPHAHF